MAVRGTSDGVVAVKLNEPTPLTEANAFAAWRVAVWLPVSRPSVHCTFARPSEPVTMAVGLTDPLESTPHPRHSRQTVARRIVGTGRGTRAFGWKGGIGTSSRVLPESLGGFTVGVLVQSNFGGILTMAGAPVGHELGRYSFREAIEAEAGGDDIGASVRDSDLLGPGNPNGSTPTTARDRS